MKKLFQILLYAIVFSALVGCVKPVSEQKSDYELDLFVEGKILVQKAGKYGFLNKKGEIVIDFIYDYANKFYNGVTVVKVDSEFFLIDEEGNQLSDQKFAYLSIEPHGGLVKIGGGFLGYSYGLMDLTGKVLLEDNFNFIDDFSEGFARYKKDRKYGFITEKGKYLTEVEYDYAESFSDGLAIVKIDSKYGYINSKGELVIDTIYDGAEPFFEGLAVVVVKTDQKYSYQVIDKTGNTLFSDYDMIERTKNVFVCSKEGKFFIIDKQGNIIPLSEKYTEVVAGGIEDWGKNVTFFVAWDGEAEYALDENGREIFSSEPEEGYEMANSGIDFVTFKGWVAFYNESTLILKTTAGDYLEYSWTSEDLEIYVFNEKIALSQNDKWGVIDFSGKQIIKFRYDFITLTRDGCAVVEKDGLLGVLDLKGNIIIPIEYEDIDYWDIDY